MLFIVLFALISLASATSCEYKSETYNDGDTWVVRSTFVMQCKVTKSGWSTSVIGCKTPSGVVVNPGSSVKVADTTYSCVALPNGRVEIRRKIDVNESKGCQGHKLGETWVSQVNFKKECTDKGVVIKECLTDSGLSVPLNGNLVLSGIKYTCTAHSDGTVTIHRDKVPTKKTFELDNLRPVEVFGPLFKKHHTFRKLLTNTPAKAVAKPVQPVQTSVVASNQMHEESGESMVTCNSDGKVYHAEETWIKDNKFTKKCTPDGSVIILNCLISEGTTINVDSELKLGNKSYKCYRNVAESRVYFEVISN